MVPTHRLRLQSMLRAMTEVVIPALDPTQQLATDQANIIVGNLRILLDQAGRTGDYDRADLRDLRMLGADLAAPELAALLAEDIAQGSAALAELLVRTRAAVDAAVRSALDDPAQATAATRAVLAHAGRQLARERTWFRAAGFELDQSALPDLNAVLD